MTNATRVTTASILILSMFLAGNSGYHSMYYVVVETKSYSNEAVVICVMSIQSKSELRDQKMTLLQWLIY